MTHQRDRQMPPPRTPGTHYCEGDPRFNRTAFVLSVPGEEEEGAGKPVAGQTGVNLDKALKYLHEARPDLFGSRDRYDYCITNAFPHPLYKKRHGRSEATLREINAPENLARVQHELDGCELVVLCGRKAQSVGAYLAKHLPALHQVEAPHVGHRGLFTLKDEAISALTNSTERTEARLKAWSKRVQKQLPHR